MKYKECLKLLREIHHEDASIYHLAEFRRVNSSIPWSQIFYKETGDTILHIAAQLGKSDIVNYILYEWPPKAVDIRNNEFKTPLHDAAQFSQPQIVKILLNHKAEIDALKRGDWTPLMLACTKKDALAFETISILVQNGANIHLVNKDGWSALHIACRTGDLKIVTLLMENYTHVNLNTFCTKNGRTILHIACLHGHRSIVEAIIDISEIDLNVRDSCGNTPFHDAVCSNNIQIVRLLFDKGANIQLQNNIGLNGVHLAASEGLVKMLKFLITELCINPNIVTQTNMTALHYAARKKRTDIIEELIQMGIDDSVKDVHGRTYEDYINL